MKDVYCTWWMHVSWINLLKFCIVIFTWSLCEEAIEDDKVVDLRNFILEGVVLGQEGGELVWGPVDSKMLGKNILTLGGKTCRHQHLFNHLWVCWDCKLGVQEADACLYRTVHVCWYVRVCWHKCESKYNCVNCTTVLIVLHAHS